MSDQLLEKVREAALQLPEVEERLSHGQPTFFVAGKQFAQFRANHHGDGRTVVCVRTSGPDEQAILLEASLSFLGLGVTEPTPSWGLMLSGSAADFYLEAPWMILFPGLAISLAVFAFNLFGDSLRDWLDPKMKT